VHAHSRFRQTGQGTFAPQSILTSRIHSPGGSQKPEIAANPESKALKMLKALTVSDTWLQGFAHTLPQARELARHGDMQLTMKYTHIGIQDQAKALAALPNPWQHFRSPWGAIRVIDCHSKAIRRSGLARRKCR
jgi:hypothetical protein